MPVPTSVSLSLNSNSNQLSVGGQSLATTDYVDELFETIDVSNSNFTRPISQTLSTVTSALNPAYDRNTALGLNSLSKYNLPDFGTSNTAVGTYSLNNNMGSQNTAVGDEALRNNSTGGNNTALGKNALFSNGDNSNNVGIGHQAVFSGSGSENTIVGSSSCDNGAIGMKNCALGFNTFGNGAGNYNVAIGYQAGALSVPIKNNKNTFLGATSNINEWQGNSSVTEGNAINNSTAIGYGSQITASNQIVLGTSTETVRIPKFTTAGVVRNNASGNLSTGKIVATDVTDYSLTNLKFVKNDGTQNTAFGVDTLKNTTTGSYSTALGYNALLSNTTGNFNTATGSNALENNTTGNHNTATGHGAFTANTTGSYSTAIGKAALGVNTTGTENTATGANSLQFNTTGIRNVANGVGALAKNTTGNQNVGMGLNTNLMNQTGSNNVVIGGDACYNNTVSNNTAVGWNSLYNNVTGTKITSLGYEAGKMNTSNNNTFLGASSDISGTWTNSTAIGFNSRINGDNQIVLGTSTETVKIPKFTTAGVVRNDASGNLSSGLIIAADITDATITGAKLVSSINLPSAATATTQISTDNTTKIATTEYVTTAVNNLVTNNTTALDTINELANALGDDKNYATTVINSLSEKAPLASPTFTGTVTITDCTEGTDLQAANKKYVDDKFGSIDVTNSTFTQQIIQTSLTEDGTDKKNIALGKGSLQEISLQEVDGTMQEVNGNNFFINGGIQNTAIGIDTLRTTSANNNTAVGYKALRTNLYGDYNTAIGSNSGADVNLLSKYNTFLGADTGQNFDTMDHKYSTAVGYGSKITGSNQIVLGIEAHGMGGATKVNIPGLKNDGVEGIVTHDGYGTLTKGGKIGNDDINNAVITGDKIAYNTINGYSILDNSTSGSKLETSSVTGNKLANGAVTNGKIEDGAITNTKIADNTIAGEKIANNTITYANIANNTITGEKIANNTITSEKIADNTIAGGKIANNTIAGEQIANRTITSNNIGWSVINDSHVAVGGLDKSRVGLANVDNTSDEFKPVSTAVRTELNLKAPKNDPEFTGSVNAPTPETGSNSTAVATTAFVKNQNYAPLASPALTGTPTAPTQASTNNSTAIATTAFVKSQTSSIVSSNMSISTSAPTNPVDGQFYFSPPTDANVVTQANNAWLRVAYTDPRDGVKRWYSFISQDYSPV